MKIVSRSIDNSPVAFEVESATGDIQRTYILCGMSRGGTTMLAGVAQKLGLDIGSDYGFTFEDPRFNLNYLTKQLGTKKDAIGAMLESISLRNEESDVWGWKFPNAYRYLNDVLGFVRNPHLVLICRDSAAVVYRGRRGGESVTNALIRTAQMNLENMKIIEKWNVPSLIISYERALSSPENFVSNLADFLGMEKPIDLEWYTKFISPGYKSLKEINEYT